MKVSDLIDTDRYPIYLDPCDPNYVNAVATFRSTLVHDGIVTLPGFLRPKALEDAKANINKLVDNAWTTDSKHNIYLDDGDRFFPEDHVRNRRLPTKVRK